MIRIHVCFRIFDLRLKKDFTVKKKKKRKEKEKERKKRKEKEKKKKKLNRDIRGRTW